MSRWGEEDRAREEGHPTGIARDGKGGGGVGERWVSSSGSGSGRAGGFGIAMAGCSGVSCRIRGGSTRRGGRGGRGEGGGRWGGPHPRRRLCRRAVAFSAQLRRVEPIKAQGEREARTIDEDGMGHELDQQRARGVDAPAKAHPHGIAVLGRRMRRRQRQWDRCLRVQSDSELRITLE